MAKKKSAKSSKSQLAPVKRKAPASKSAGTLKSDNQPAADAASAFTGITIGHTAGEVWGLLNGGQPRTIAEIKKSMKAPADVVVAAIGWLAREDKLEFVTNGKTVKIGLR